MRSRLGQLRLKFGDGARGVIGLLFQPGILALEPGHLDDRGRGVGQAGGEGVALLADDLARVRGVVRGRGELEKAFEVINGVDRLRELLGINHAELVLGIGQLGIGREGGFVLIGGAGGVVTVEILLGRLDMRVVRIVVRHILGMGGVAGS